MNEPKTYNGNPYLKRSGSKHEWTIEEIEDFKKCKDDILHFATKISIQTIDHGLQKVKLWDFQTRVIQEMKDNRFVTANWPRQSSKTTLATIIILHDVLFTGYRNFFILANKEATAKEVLERVKMAFMYLPKHLQCGIESWDKTNIKFDNGSKVFAATTSSDSIRGKTGSIYCDEVAFIDGFHEFWLSTFPVLSSGKTSRAILTSTPNGLNHWHKIYSDSVSGKSEFHAIAIKWYDVPGRDEEWKKKTIDTIGLEAWLQEFEAEFMGSAGSLISSSYLRDVVTKEPLEIKECVNYYDYPATGHNYLITVDTSHGKGLDYSVAMVFDATAYPIKQVAVFRSDMMSPLLYPNIIAQLGTYYNDAAILVESNDLGSEVVNGLNYDLEYDNIISEKTGLEKKSSLGVRTTKLTKRLGCANLKSLFESGKLTISDKETILELSSFIAKGSSYEADKGFHDDCVMCCVMLAWYAASDNFAEDMAHTVKEELYATRIKRLEEELIPFGYISDGTEDIEESWAQV